MTEREYIDVKTLALVRAAHTLLGSCSPRDNQKQFWLDALDRLETWADELSACLETSADEG